jgi:hypothetical protein
MDLSLVLKPPTNSSVDDLNNLSRTFFGVDVAKVTEEYSTENIYSRIKELRQEIISLYGRLNGKVVLGDYALTPEIVEGYHRLFPFLRGIHHKKDEIFTISMDEIPMELLFGQSQNSGANSGVAFVTLPLYSYDLNFGPGFMQFEVKTNLDWLEQEIKEWRHETGGPVLPTWDRNGSRGFAHPHVNGPGSTFSSFCAGTNDFARYVQTGRMKKVGDLNTFVFGALLWTKSYNLDDSYGGYVSPPFNSVINEARNECRSLQGVCSSILKNAGAVLKNALNLAGGPRITNPEGLHFTGLSRWRDEWSDELYQKGQEPTDNLNIPLNCLRRLLVSLDHVQGNIEDYDRADHQAVAFFGVLLYLWQAAYAILLLSNPAGLQQIFQNGSVTSALIESMYAAVTLSEYVSDPQEHDPSVLGLGRYADLYRVLDCPKAVLNTNMLPEVADLFRVEY